MKEWAITLCRTLTRSRVEILPKHKSSTLLSDLPPNAIFAIELDALCFCYKYGFTHWALSNAAAYSTILDIPVLKQDRLIRSLK